MKKFIKWVGLLSIVLLVVSACGNGGSSDSGSSNGDKLSIKVGSKNFTESLILGEMYALALENAGYDVERKLNLGGTMVAHEGLKSGEIDMYPEYTGTGLINILEEEPRFDAQEVYDLVKEGYKEQFDLVWLEPTDANNSQGLVASKKAAEEYDLYTISRLQEVAKDIRMAAVPEFTEREDGLIGLEKHYGEMDFKSLELFDHGIKYNVLKNDEADVTVGFTTDGDLISEDLVLLEDDKNFWPPYYVAPVIRNEVLEQDPKVADVLNEVSKLLNDEVVQKLNAEVDINSREYAEVAKEFLVEEGIISE